MKRALHTLSTGSVTPGRKLGFGGEGEVYEVLDRPELVVKLYYEPPSLEKAEKLRILSQLGTQRLLSLSAWPVDVALDEPNGKVLGFLMPRVSHAEEVHSLHSPKSRLQKFPEASWSFLIYVAANIARALSVIHEHGFVVGDLNPKNILVTRNATVYLLDCDSFQTRVKEKTYRCDAGFPEYTPPELQGIAFKETDRSPNHDAFGLAIILFQLLFLGRHPFSGRFLGEGEMPLERAIREGRYAFGDQAGAYQMQPPPGALSVTALPPPLARLFHRAFMTATAAERPRPEEWVSQLKSLAGSLKNCALHSGHFYYHRLSYCPWCGIESRARTRLFNFLLPASEGRAAPFRLDEIWKAIEAVPPPPLKAAKSPDFKGLTLSEKAKTVADARGLSLFFAILFSAAAGVGAPLLAETPTAILILILSALAGIRIARIDLSIIWQPRQLFQPQAFSNNHPSLAAIRRTHEVSKEFVQRLEEIYERETGVERFQKRLDELGARRGAYINLQRTFEQSFRQIRVHEGLQEKRILAEKEFDRRRIQLEDELRRGVVELQRVRHEIVLKRRVMETELAAGRRALAQAEIDYQEAAKRNPLLPILMILLICFLMGMAIKPSSPRVLTPLPTAPPKNSTPADEEKSRYSGDIANAQDYYKQAVALSREEQFQTAAQLLQQAIELDPNPVEYYEELGYVWYRVGNYYGAIDVSTRGLSNIATFSLNYHKALAQAALEELESARQSFASAFLLIRIQTWDDRMPDAIDRYVEVLKKLDEAEDMIQQMEDIVRIEPDASVERFLLADLYAANNDYTQAAQQYKILARKNSSMARDLKKIVRKRRPGIEP